MFGGDSTEVVLRREKKKKKEKEKKKQRRQREWRGDVGRLRRDGQELL